MAVERAERDALLGEYRGWVIRDWRVGYQEALIPTWRWLELAVERAEPATAAECADLLVRLAPVSASSRRVIAARFPGAGGG